MMRRGLFLAVSLATGVAFGTACLSSSDEPVEVEQTLNASVLPQPGPGLPPGTVVVPLPAFEIEPVTVAIPSETGSLHAEILGRGNEAIVIVNGGPGLNSVFVTRLHQGMAKRLPGRRIVRYDQRGLGGSTPTTAEQNTIAGNVEDLESIRRFLGVRKLHLVGQSFGGFVAGAYASTHPRNVASIAFIDPLPPLPADSEFTTAGFDAIGTYYDSLLAAGILEPGSDDDPPGVAWNRIIGVYFANPLVVPLEITAPATEFNVDINEAVDADYQENGAPLVENVGRLRLPVLIIGGSLSAFGPHFVQGTAAAFQGARPKVVTIQGAGHLAWFDKPQATLGALQAFFDDCAPGR
jgi:pimeloyl-ACP methyl ester carboxylesterase